MLIISVYEENFSASEEEMQGGVGHLGEMMGMINGLSLMWRCKKKKCTSDMHLF